MHALARITPRSVSTRTPRPPHPIISARVERLTGTSRALWTNGAPNPSLQYQSVPSSPLYQSAQEKRSKSLAISQGPTSRCAVSCHSPASGTTEAGLTPRPRGPPAQSPGPPHRTRP